MGFKGTKTYTLIFDDPELDGLEVKTKSMPLGRMRMFMGMQEKGWSNSQATDEMIRVFAEALLSWNLENDDDSPVPATEDGINSQDPKLMLSIINTWAATVMDVDSDLGKDSSSGRRSLVESIPMETLSPSQAS